MTTEGAVDGPGGCGAVHGPRDLQEKKGPQRHRLQFSRVVSAASRILTQCAAPQGGLLTTFPHPLLALSLCV
jgi:hypothetical protein